jgi:hypothetical protein
MSETPGVRQRVAARDALAVRMRALTGGALTASALLSAVFAGIAAASAPGHKLLSRTTAQRTTGAKTPRTTASVGMSKAIPPLPPPPGPGNLGAASPPTAAPAPNVTQAPPVAVSGGS